MNLHENQIRIKAIYMMNNGINTSRVKRALFPGLLACCLTLSVEAGSLYKWIDEDGQIRYSDRLPPETSKKKHQQLDSRGLVINTREAAKSEEEAAAEAEAAAIEEEKMAAERAIKDAQYKKDKVLLLTFSSDEELLQVKNNRLEVIDSVIRLINNSIASNQEKLDKLQEHAQLTYTSKEKDIPGGLAQKLEHFQRTIENRSAQLQSKMEERSKIDQQYDQDLARFRELKGQ